MSSYGVSHMVMLPPWFHSPVRSCLSASVAETRTEATWDMLLAYQSWHLWLCTSNALARKEGGKVDVHLSNADQMTPLCWLLSIQGKKVLHLWRQFLCGFPFLLSSLPATPHSCFSPNSTRFTAEERCHLLSLITHQQTETPLVCFGQLGLIMWIMQVGFGMEPGRRVN